MFSVTGATLLIAKLDRLSRNAAFLLTLRDSRISSDGILVIKAQRFRTQEKNRADALERLRQLVLEASRVQKKRRPTKPTRSSQKKRMDAKTQRGRLKKLRRSIDD